MADAIPTVVERVSDAQSFNSPDGFASATPDHGLPLRLIAGEHRVPEAGGWGAGDFGTDGGVLASCGCWNWNGQTINFRGSMVSLYAARQFVGIYRANSSMYAPGALRLPVRHRLPTLSCRRRRAPMFRDVSTPNSGGSCAEPGRSALPAWRATSRFGRLCRPPRRRVTPRPSAAAGCGRPR
jgi:hypothetical protein